MAFVNENYRELKENYLFADIARKVAQYSQNHPEKKIIRMGIGDVTLPLAHCVIEAMKNAVTEMGVKETFRGYGPEQGYDFLQNAIVGYYAQFGIQLAGNEIFISDGAKSDTGNITDIFDDCNVVLIPDPVYPVYLDTNLMRGHKIMYMAGNEENQFLPMPDKNQKADIIYLCSPNNPTGAVYNRDQLKVWVDYALQQNAVILYDAAYESFVSSKDIPRSIYEIEGAAQCSIEFCSLSKTAGFTGTRCGYTVVPKDLVRQGRSGNSLNLNKMWLRRQTTKFNGVSYIVQRGAEAVFSTKGQQQCRDSLNYYMQNAKTIMECMNDCGIKYFGGVHSPYIWLKCPREMKSWKLFEYLLDKIAVVGTPGAGFGACGEGYFRLTSFNTHENTVEAMTRFKNLFGKGVM